MAKGTNADVRIFPDLAALSHAVAQSLVKQINSNVAAGGMFSLVLSGGETPRALYELLSTEYRDRIPWRQVHLFWGDERFVPADDPRSNYRMAEETLLRRVPVPVENVHPMRTDFPAAEQAAEAYEADLKNYFKKKPQTLKTAKSALPRFNSALPRFDLVLLGMGAEGHTASLFPNSPALDERERWVAAVRAAAEPPVRLTLTLPALNGAACVYFLVAGAQKARALRQATAGALSRDCPASMVRPEEGEVTWWADQGAAEMLGRES